jgi:hypothetical protein
VFGRRKKSIIRLINLQPRIICVHIPSYSEKLVQFICTAVTQHFHFMEWLYILPCLYIRSKPIVMAEGNLILETRLAGRGGRMAVVKIKRNGISALPFQGSISERGGQGIISDTVARGAFLIGRLGEHF